MEKRVLIVSSLSQQRAEPEDFKSSVSAISPPRQSHRNKAQIADTGNPVSEPTPVNVQQLVWLDLCSGLGGASQPAKDRGWTVIRVDIDPRFKPDIVADVRSLPLSVLALRRRINVLWASTPCTEYAKWQLRCFYPNPSVPDISLEVGVVRAIEQLKPDTYIVENVWAARPWLSQLFGPVRAKPPGHALWSNQCLMLPNIKPHKGNYRRHLGSRYDKNKRRYVSNGPHGKSIIPHADWWAKRGKSYVGTEHNGTTPQEAARIPYEIGEAICIAVERRMGLYESATSTQ